MSRYHLEMGVYFYSSVSLPPTLYGKLFWYKSKKKEYLLCGWSQAETVEIISRDLYALPQMKRNLQCKRSKIQKSDTAAHNQGTREITWVESLDARVISRLPLRPSNGGTRIIISGTSRNTFQFYQQNRVLLLAHNLLHKIKTTKHLTNMFR